MEWVVCSPGEYYSPRMKAFINEECRLPRNQWIYHIIQNNVKHTDERIFLNSTVWCLCLDKQRCAPAPPQHPTLCVWTMS